MIRVLIADDHSIVRDGLRQLFSATSDICIVDEAVDGPSLLEYLKSSNEYDLLMTDMNMPGVNGIELIKAAKKSRSKLPIIVFSMHGESHVALSALKSGASGYFSKSSDPKLLLSAIRKISADASAIVIDPSIAEQMAIASAFPKHTHKCLSERELHVFCLIADGHSLNTIGTLLSLSNKTISAHKARIMEKMQFSNSSDLMRYAIENELTYKESGNTKEILSAGGSAL